MRVNTFLSIFAIMAFSVVFAGCVTVDPGHAGVRVLMGNLNPEAHPPGFHLTGFASVQEISLQAQNMNDSVAEDSNEAAQVTFGDTLQSLGYTANMQWRVSSPEAAVALFEEYNLRERGENQFAESELRPILREAVKQIFNDYTLRDLIGQRDEAAVRAEQRMQELIDDRLTVPAGSIQIDDIAITNFDYDDQLEDAFRRTIQARQQQELASQELERERINMEQEVMQAEASRRASVERANGEAEAARIEADAARYVREQEAEAEAAFYRALAASGVDPNIYVTMQTWNGTVPMVQGSSSGDSGNNMPIVLPLNMMGQ